MVPARNAFHPRVSRLYDLHCAEMQWRYNKRGLVEERAMQRVFCRANLDADLLQTFLHSTDHERVFSGL